jgi:hypothetical protein
MLCLEESELNDDSKAILGDEGMRNDEFMVTESGIDLIHGDQVSFHKGDE